jgi:Ca-activated chloride channel family protein
MNTLFDWLPELQRLGFHPGSAWWLLLLPLAFLAVLPRWRRRATLVHASTRDLAAAGRSWVGRIRWLPPSLRIAGIVLLIICIARPIKANERSEVFVEGIAIQSVIDRSGSMRALDFELAGGRVDRLTAVKKVLTDFIEGDDDLMGRPDDLVGLITFAGFADTVSPLTLDHPYVIDALDKVRIATEQSEDGTAIGDAIALAVERLRELDERGDEAGRRIKSRVIVLLTDGENNAGDLDPLVAAEIASAFDVRIYAIGVGSNGVAPVPARDPFGRQIMGRQRVSIDEETLEAVADATGGKYFRATNTDSLRRIYTEIDDLEKTTTEQRRYRSYRDLAVQPLSLGGLELPPLLLIALLLLASEQILVHTRFRTLP